MVLVELQGHQGRVEWAVDQGLEDSIPTWLCLLPVETLSAVTAPLPHLSELLRSP